MTRLRAAGYSRRGPELSDLAVGPVPKSQVAVAVKLARVGALVGAGGSRAGEVVDVEEAVGAREKHGTVRHGGRRAEDRVGERRPERRAGRAAGGGERVQLAVV